MNLNLKVNPFWTNKIAIAFDVSTRSTGYAYRSPFPTQNKITGFGAVGYAAIQPPERYSVTERIRCLYENILNIAPIMFANKDCYVFIEEGFFKHSGKTSLMLGEARGAVICGVGAVSAIVEVPVATWKKHLGCQLEKTKGEHKGDLEKEMAHKILCDKWGFDIPITKLKGKKTYDVSDAFGILTYALENLEFYEVK